MSATNGSVLSPASGAMARLAAATRSALALIGLAVVIVSALPAAREPLLRQVAPAAAPASDGEAPSADAAPREAAGRGAVHERETRALVEFIARRYRVAEEAIAGFVAAAYRAGSERRLDPLLLLAVMAVESRFNPVADSVLGAKGLMQVIGRFHLD
ncbi:MAG: transglycosylase SLT domain-containing protein, partial [Elioraea sp.]|nr:transglycosylase SLT domain-containing protein [Elioraea sp.]